MFGLIIIGIMAYLLVGMFITWLYVEKGGGRKDLEGLTEAEKMLFIGIIFPLIVPVLLIFFYLRKL